MASARAAALSVALLAATTYSQTPNPSCTHFAAPPGTPGGSYSAFPGAFALASALCSRPTLTYPLSTPSTAYDVAALAQSNADWICASFYPASRILPPRSADPSTSPLFFRQHAGQDSTDNSTYLYTYTFNVCKNVIAPPAPFCTAAGPAAAYQWSPSLAVCYPLSADLSVTPPPRPRPGRPPC